MKCPVSQQSSLIPEKLCVSGRVKHGVGRGALLLFHICYPCGLSTVEAFISCRGQTGAFPSSEFTYKREHMNCSFISHPSCLCHHCSQSALVVLHLCHLQICFNQDLFFVVYQLDGLFAFSSLSPVISTLTGLHTVSADLGLEIHRREASLIPFQLHAVFSLG